MLTKQDIKRCIGNMIICGFEGTSLNAELKEIIREVSPLGLILFSRNIECLEHIKELNRELKTYRKDAPLILCVDQEGGRVARLKKPFIELPPMEKLGSIGDKNLIENIASAQAKELRSLYFDVNFAPILDVNTNPDNPVIGDRAFSSDPYLAGEYATYFMRGLEKNGILACGKHFPGHGDTSTDSHFTLPYVEHDIKRLKNIEWVPFKNAIQENLRAIMTAHIMLTQIDEKFPATLSKKIISILRQYLNFDGVIISDDIEMKALSEHYTIDEIAYHGLNAGINIFLVCRDPNTIIELYVAIDRLVKSKFIDKKSLMKIEEKNLLWSRKYFKKFQEQNKCIDYVKHENLVREIENKF